MFRGGRHRVPLLSLLEVMVVVHVVCGLYTQDSHATKSRLLSHSLHVFLCRGGTRLLTSHPYGFASFFYEVKVRFVRPTRSSRPDEVDVRRASSGIGNPDFSLIALSVVHPVVVPDYWFDVAAGFLHH